jgi:hypothetical protein
MFLLMLAAEASAAPAQPPAMPEPITPIDFDLQNVAPASAANEIVVTARRNDQRLEPLTAFAAAPAIPRAETGLIGNLRAGIAAEQHQLPGGVVSNRLMVKLKLPF